MALRIATGSISRLFSIYSSYSQFSKCNKISPKLVSNVVSKPLWRNVATESNGTDETELSGKEAEENKDIRDVKKDRIREIPVEVSIEYLKSKAYKTTYGNVPVWTKYRRNFKGQWAPETRKTCIRQGQISTGNPCPICRDEYLVVDYQNIDLLKQFVSPYTGEILPTMKTGLCQKRQLELLVAIKRAKDYGYLAFDVPLRDYDYSEYGVKSN